MSSIGVQVSSVLIPLAKRLLLLPNVVVAEVINYSKPTVRKRAPEWFLGDIVWRGTSVPVISIDGLMGDLMIEPGRRGRIIVLNTINGENDLTHIGIVSQAIPSLVRVTSESISSLNSTHENPSLVTYAVEVEAKHAVIPDLDALEKIVVDFLAG
jgi:chemosensory pili system protein ChpC